jgi:septal ring factor EnvC (AmiA/AmiB activator)
MSALTRKMYVSGMAMDIAALENMTPAEICQALKTTQLEHAYERALQQSERIYEEERARALRVQLLLLEDENDALQDQLAESEAQIEKLEDGHDEVRESLLQTEADLQRAQTDLKSRLRDIDHYRAELNNLNTMSSDSTKLLTEKLSLARELAVLKPELEHLRSQAIAQQNLLAEKLSLQRELSTLQVELETEKRAVQRTKAKDAKSGEDESKLEGQIDELKKELAKEKREAQKNDRDARKQAADWEGQKTILESKLDAFRNKLRSTKEQLKETQAELEQAQAAKATRDAEFAQARPGVANPRKRPVARFDPDSTIGTPGVAAKKPRTSTLPGDKSTFSITPFLNRTMSLAPESPASQEKKADEAINQQIDAIIAENAPSSPAPPPKAKIVKKGGGAASAKPKEPQPLKDTTIPKANTNIQKQRTTTNKTTLAKVTEEADENEESTGNSSVPNIQQKQPVKKKQKLLGQRKSLFDDDDDEGEQSKSRGLMGLSKGLGLRGGAGMGMISLAGKGKTLAEFSPLKKDRRAAPAAVGAA